MLRQLTRACRTYTIAQAAGARGTVKINNFTQHLTSLLHMPDSNVPINYVDLLWAALPAYRTSKNACATHGTVGVDSQHVTPSSRLTDAQKLSTSEVTTADPDVPLDPEEIPVSMFRVDDVSDDDAEADSPGHSGHARKHSQPEAAKADDDVRNADAYAA